MLPIMQVPAGWKMDALMLPASRARSSSDSRCSPGKCSDGAYLDANAFPAAAAVVLPSVLPLPLPPAPPRTMRRARRRALAATRRSWPESR